MEQVKKKLATLKEEIKKADEKHEEMVQLEKEAISREEEVSK